MKTPSAPGPGTEARVTQPPTPGTAETRPFPDKGKGPTDPRRHPVAPPAPAPDPAPGTPIPAVTAAPEPAIEPKTAERPVAQKPPTQETVQVLADDGKRDRRADAAEARKIDNKDDAKRLLMTILGGGVVAVGAGATDRPNLPRAGERSRRGYRPSAEEVGRTQQDRERTVSSMVHRFQGSAPQPAPAGSFHRDQRSFESIETRRHTQFYEGNRRVIRYSSVQEIPPVIVASQQLNRVQVLPQAQSTYNVRPQAPQPGVYYNDIPPSYTTGEAYAVSYSVDPNSAISTNDILFRQGSTDFADAYSYDLVIDIAEAMKAPALSKETFVIEGHASAEGDYSQNLLLSQERAERISRELVRHGVSAERLMPVGYGEAEAAHPANAPEPDRSLDRRVVVFRMR